MSHSLILGALLLGLVSSEASQPNEVSTSPIIAKTREVVVEENNKTKGLSIKSFCKRALQKHDPTAVIMDGEALVPLTEFCQAYVPYAIHSGGNTGNAYIKYNQGKSKWIDPKDFCANETAANCNKLITIKYNGAIANPQQPTKSLGAYCKGYGKDLGCTPHS